MNRRKENSFNPPRVTVGNNLQSQKYTQADSNLFLTLLFQGSLGPLGPLTVPTHSGTVFSLPGMLFPHFAFWYQTYTRMTLFSICAADASMNDSLQKSLPNTASGQPPPKGSLPLGSCLPWGIKLTTMNGSPLSLMRAGTPGHQDRLGLEVIHALFSCVSSGPSLQHVLKVC